MIRPIPLARVLLSLLTALTCASVVFGQGASGTITGTVSDETGAVMPGANVVIRNEETGVARELVTGEGGRFRAPDLAPGPYSVTAAMTGFTTVARRGIVLTVGREAVVDIALTVGTLQDVITVVGEAPTVDTRSSSTGGLISQEQIENLPLNGRSFIELANLTPGVQLTDNGGRSTSTGFGRSSASTDRATPQNLFTIDGTMMNDQFNQAGSASGNVLGVEAVGEFQVLTNSFSAEFGRHTGAVINAVTKTGTNNFRGSLFEFHRGDKLDSRGWESKPDDLSKPDFKRNQFGFSAGGRSLRKDVLLRHLRRPARNAGHRPRRSTSSRRRSARRRRRAVAAVPRLVPRCRTDRARRQARRVHPPGQPRDGRGLRGGARR